MSDERRDWDAKGIFGCPFSSKHPSRRAVVKPRRSELAPSRRPRGLGLPSRSLVTAARTVDRDPGASPMSPRQPGQGGPGTKAFSPAQWRSTPSSVPEPLNPAPTKQEALDSRIGLAALRTIRRPIAGSGGCGRGAGAAARPLPDRSVRRVVPDARPSRTPPSGPVANVATPVHHLLDLATVVTVLSDSLIGFLWSSAPPATISTAAAAQSPRPVTGAKVNSRPGGRLVRNGATARPWTPAGDRHRKKLRRAAGAGAGRPGRRSDPGGQARSWQRRLPAPCPHLVGTQGSVSSDPSSTRRPSPWIPESQKTQAAGSR